MAGKAKEVKVAVDEREFSQGLRKMADDTEATEEAIEHLADAGDDLDFSGPLDKTDKALNDTARALDKTETAAEKTGRAIDELGDEGQKTGKKLERALKDATDQTKNLDRAAKDSEGALGKLGEGGAELNDELRSNLSETVSSFRGDFSDLGQLGQDTLGGLATGLGQLFGPGGMIAAAVAAGGLGMILGSLEEQNEAAKRLRENLISAYADAAAEGRNYLDAAQIITGVQDLITDPDREKEYKKILEDVNTLQLDRTTVLRAAVGDQEALNLVMARYGELAKEVTGTYGPASKQKFAVDDLQHGWAQVAETAQKASETGAIIRETTSATLMSFAAAAEAATVEIDALGNRMVTLPDGTEFYVSADTGQATQDLHDFVDSADNSVREVSGKEAVVQVTTDTTPAEQRNRVLQAYYDNLKPTVPVTAKANIAQAVKDLADAARPRNTTINANTRIDTSAVDAAIWNMEHRTVQIDVEYVPRNSPKTIPQLG